MVSFEIKARANGEEILFPVKAEKMLTTYAGTNRNIKVNLALAERVVVYFNITKSTTRATAKQFGISHSTVYRYLTKVLPNEKSLAILAKNKKERSSRGGKATAAKRKKEQS